MGLGEVRCSKDRALREKREALESELQERRLSQVLAPGLFFLFFPSYGASLGAVGCKAMTPQIANLSAFVSTIARNV